MFSIHINVTHDWYTVWVFVESQGENQMIAYIRCSTDLDALHRWQRLQTAVLQRNIASS